MNENDERMHAINVGERPNSSDSIRCIIHKHMHVSCIPRAYNH